MYIPRFVYTVSDVLLNAGYQAYLVGGCVRDGILGTQPKDYDLATDCTPETLCHLFRDQARFAVIPTGLRYGTITIRPWLETGCGPSIEVTTFRTESQYSDGRRPDQVSFGTSIVEDLARRDFTMNAIAHDLTMGKLIDPFNGAQDIERRTIRFVGEPRVRVQEDALRIMRAVRFQAQLGFTFGATALQALTDGAALLRNVSAERITAEWFKLCAGPYVSQALWSFLECGLDRVIFPELAACRGVEQNAWHGLNVFEHCALACENLAILLKHARDKRLKACNDTLALVAEPQRTPLILTAMLLHDIGKPTALSLDAQNQRHFYGHEYISGELAAHIASRMKLSTNDQLDLITMVRGHMRLHHLLRDGTTPSTRVMRHFFEDYPRVWRELMLMTLADTAATTGPLANCAREIPQLCDLYQSLIAFHDGTYALAVATPLLQGRDLLARGMEPGPAMGTVLKAVDQLAREGVLTAKEQALDYALKNYPHLMQSKPLTVA